ncbi:MAG: hypothetical protein JWN34_4711 [Bryobacterales bacterium]|nr:hypothetical protein [Bryobacterales bacterium]
MTNRLAYCRRAFPSRVGEPLDGGARQLYPSSLLADGSASFQTLLEDGERVFRRVGRHANAGGSVLPAAEHPTSATRDRLGHAYARKDELDGAWALGQRKLMRQDARTTLVLKDPGAGPLPRLPGVAVESAF